MRKFNAKNLRREVQKQLKELRGGGGRKTEGQLKIEKVAFEREQRLLASSAEHSDFNGVNGELKINSNDYDTSIESKSKNDEGLTISDEGLTISGEGLMVNGEGLTINDERLAVSGERLEGSDDEKIVNCPLSRFVPMSENQARLNSHSECSQS